MSVDDLIRARQALAAGVGKTTRENRDRAAARARQQEDQNARLARLGC
jgi:hypothetical protein